MRIHLLGFMASGKTSLGPELARAGALDFLDLDEEIAAAAGRGIPEIFRVEGEAFFRDLESRALENLAGRDGLVLATGGGVVETERNHALLRAGTGIYLHWPWEVLRRRLASLPAAERPLVAEGEAALAERWRRREPLYRKLARQTLDMPRWLKQGSGALDLPRLTREILDLARGSEA